MERLNSYGWLFLLIAMAGDLIVSFVLSLFYSGYNNLKMSISALGNPASPVRIPFNIWMLIEGVLFLLAIPSIHKLYHEISGGITVTMIVFIIAFAVALRPLISPRVLLRSGSWHLTVVTLLKASLSRARSNMSVSMLSINAHHSRALLFQKLLQRLSKSGSSLSAQVLQKP